MSKEILLFCTSDCGVFSYRSSQEAVKRLHQMSNGLTKNDITLPDIRSDCLASLELFILYKWSLQSCFFFLPPFYQKKNEVRGLWMLGTCLFFEILHVSSDQCSLSFFSCHFCKEKKHHFIYFLFNILWMFMHFIFVQLPALFLTVNKREPFTCFCSRLFGHYWRTRSLFLVSEN